MKKCVNILIIFIVALLLFVTIYMVIMFEPIMRENRDLKMSNEILIGDNHSLEESLAWNKQLQQKIDSLTHRFPNMGGSLKELKRKIDSGELEYIEPDFEDLPEEYNEIKNRERCFSKGYKRYKWSVPGFVCPLIAEGTVVTCEYGCGFLYIYQKKLKKIKIYRRDHTGADFNNKSDRSVIASRTGTVITVYESCKWYGKYVLILHNVGKKKFITGYGHLEHIYVKHGDKVFVGDTIGAIGNTGFSMGSHLHFEIWEYFPKVGWRTINPFRNAHIHSSVSFKHYRSAMYIRTKK